MNVYFVTSAAAGGNICPQSYYLARRSFWVKTKEKVAVRGLSFGLRQGERLGRLRQSNSFN